MGNSQKPEPSPYVDDANYLSIWFASHWPDRPIEVSMFLQEAARALGGREADLAWHLGVTKATLSGWKARGSIPAVHSDWFAKIFPFSVLSNATPARTDDLHHPGLATVMHLLRDTDFNPFCLNSSSHQEHIEVVCHYLPGLARLARFIELRLQFDHDVSQIVGIAPEVRAAHDLGAMVRAVAPRLLSGIGVSQ